jgi:hypothetical protein
LLPPHASKYLVFLAILLISVNIKIAVITSFFDAVVKFIDAVAQGRASGTLI